MSDHTLTTGLTTLIFVGIIACAALSSPAAQTATTVASDSADAAQLLCQLNLLDDQTLGLPQNTVETVCADVDAVKPYLDLLQAAQDKGRSSAPRVSAAKRDCLAIARAEGLLQ